MRNTRRAISTFLAACILAFSAVPGTVLHAAAEESYMLTLHENDQMVYNKAVQENNGKADKQEGASYVYSDILANEDGITVNARITIVNVDKYASLYVFDDDTRTPGRFSPTVNTTKDGGYGVTFKIDFFCEDEDGEEIPVFLNGFKVTAVDIDGGESVALTGFLNYITDEQKCALTITPRTDGFTQFYGEGNLADCNFDDTRSFIAEYAVPVSSLQMELKNYKSTGDRPTSSQRMYSINFGVAGGVFTNPKPTKNPTSPTITLTPDKDTYTHKENTLTQVNITGTTDKVEAGKIVNITISDGTETVKTTAVVQADGTYETVADVTKLYGEAEITATVVNGAGNPASLDQPVKIKVLSESKILFDANGGEGAPSGITGQADDVIPVNDNAYKFPTTKPTLEGYTFSEWNTKADGTGSKVTAYPSHFPPRTTTYYAQYTADPAYIKFDANGGTGAPTGLTGTTDAAISATFPGSSSNPTRTGYDFKGWYSDAAGEGTKITAYPTKFPAGTTTYYAKWEAQEAEIEFNANGGTGAPAGISGNHDDAITDTFPKDEPTRTGYTFKGWYPNAAGTGTEVTDYPDKFTTGTTTYYAKWEADDAEIVFDANGGKDAPAGTAGKTDDDVTDAFPSATPTRDGYDFDGWYLTAAGTGTKQTDYPDTFPAGTTTYYAKWKAKEAKIVFNANGGTGAPDGITGKTDAEIKATFPTAEPTRTGYTFKGWYPNQGGTGTKVSGYPSKYPAGTTTYYAKWEADEAKIVFNANGGKNPPSGITGKTDDTISQDFPDTEPTREGYEFAGWTKNQNGTGGDVTAYPDKLPVGTTTYYAQWTAKSANIEFDANGGDDDSVPTGITGTTDATITSRTLPTDEPTRDGYTFDGWYFDSDCTDDNKVTQYPAKFPAGTTTYYAKWDPDEAEIVFNANDGDASSVPDGITGVTDGKITETFPTDDPTREGYTFEGWYLTAAGTGEKVTEYPDNFPVGTTTYYAKWTADEAKIEFNANKGKNPPDGIEGVTDEEITDRTLPTGEPTRVGYTFKGWYSDQACSDGNEISQYPLTFPAGTTTYYAKWAADGSVIEFDANGGDDESVPDGIAGDTDEVIADRTLPAGEPTREGYTFAGWYSDADCTEGNEVNSYPEKFAAGVETYYAKWIADPAEFVFDANGGDVTSVPGAITGVTDEVIIDKSLPTREPNREGYTFDGWFSDVACMGGYEVSALPDKFPAGTTTYFAKWTADPAIIRFNANGGDPASAPKAIIGVTDEAITDTSLPAQEPTREGYTFEGWFSDVACMGGYEVNQYPDKFPVGTTTYYAKWTADPAKITFDANGGDTAAVPGAITGVTDGVIIDRFPAEEPTRPGYTFEGWFADAAGTGDKVTSYPDQFPVGTTTYYAKWKAEPAKITFDANGGDKDTIPADLIGATNQPINEQFPAEEPQREGYTFKEWNTQPDGKGTTVTEFPDSFSQGDTDLYAIWLPNTAEIRFDGNGGANLIVPLTGVTDEIITAHFPTFEPVLTGYVFKGWNTRPDGTGTFITSYPDRFSAGVVTYYAVWEVQPEKPTPDTGDHSDAMLWLSLMAAAGLGMAGSFILNKKKKKEEQ
ncbi:MAG: InlB B-repeat-containing protein [Lachnospiraceae bacterium]|nr:InlB B-repeat-containing protein [Lachnospiraceae bacterium]